MIQIPPSKIYYISAQVMQVDLSLLGGSLDTTFSES